MDRVDSDDYTTVGGKRQYTDGSPPLTPATVLASKWLNAVQEELLKVIEDAGLTPSDADVTQLRQALDVLYGRLAAANTWTGAQVVENDVTIEGDLVVGTIATPTSATVKGNLFVEVNTLMDGQLSVGDLLNVSNGITGGSLTSNGTLHVTGLTRLTGGVENATAATASTPQNALDLKNGNLKLSGAVPNSNVGFSNTLTPLSLPKAWVRFTTDGLGGVTLQDGFNVTNVAVSGADVNVTFAAAFANTNYIATGAVYQGFVDVIMNAQTTTVATVRVGTQAGGGLGLNVTPLTVDVVFYGRQ